MTSIQENAITILRVLHDEIGFEMTPRSEVALLAQLSESDFDKADQFLLDMRYVEGTLGGMSGSIWLTSSGVEYLNKIMIGRLPLTLDAERILKYLVSVTSPEKQDIDHTKIMMALDISWERYEGACKVLYDFGFIKRLEEQFKTILITKEGSQTVHRKFKDSEKSILIMNQDDTSEIEQLDNSSEQIGLYKAIKTSLNEDELEELAFFMSIDYDSIPGKDKSKKALNLVKFCSRNKRLPQLIDKFHELRPNVSIEA